MSRILRWFRDEHPQHPWRVFIGGGWINLSLLLAIGLLFWAAWAWGGSDWR